MIRSTTDEMLAARHDRVPWLNRAGQRASVAPGDYAPHGWVFDPRVECIPSRYLVLLGPKGGHWREWRGIAADWDDAITKAEAANPGWEAHTTVIDVQNPRPEPNPILVDVRKYRAERLAMNNPKDWAHVLRKFESAAEANPWGATPAQIEDARKVLEKIVGVFG